MIIEGLNVLQGNGLSRTIRIVYFVSDFVDFSIYVDADKQLLKEWYIQRFLRFRKSAFSDPSSYFIIIRILMKMKPLPPQVGSGMKSITRIYINILPHRERANLI